MMKMEVKRFNKRNLLQRKPKRKIKMRMKDQKLLHLKTYH